MAITQEPTNDKKNKVNESVGDLAAPAEGKTFSLRHVALTLSQVIGGSPNPDVDGLLTRLQGGEVRSGFHCKARDIIWIEIPKDYWLAVTSQQLRSILQVRGKKDRPGLYSVRLEAFSSAYVEAWMLPTVANVQATSRRTGEG